MTRFSKILSISAVASLLIGTACTDDVESVAKIEQFGDAGRYTVTLDIQPEENLKGTRADQLPTHKISDGSDADFMIFAVYKSTDNGATWSVDEKYVKHKSIELNSNTITAGKGQNIFDISDDKKNTFFPFRLELVMEDGCKYKVAFWAGHSDYCKFNSEEDEDKDKVFDISDLKNVKVNYTYEKDGKVQYYPNNDEFRDAFCATSPVLGAETNKTTQVVVLKRPFAQINLGTTGADYDNLRTNKYLYPTYTIQYSKVEIEGACNSIDVLNNTISKTSDFNGKITFEWNKIAAYFDMEIPSSITSDPANGEEMLYVKLNGDNNDPKPFVTKYPTLQIKQDVWGAPYTEYLTETFKYLSMCYVLVPATTTTTVQDVTTGSVLSSVKIYLSEIKDPQGGDKDKGWVNLNLVNVPVQRNWRTNILCGLSATPDDKTSIFKSTALCVHFDPIYQGEYNKINGETTKWEENEFSGDLEQKHEDNDHETTVSGGK